MLIGFSGDVRHSADSVVTHDPQTHVAIHCQKLLRHLPEDLNCHAIAGGEREFFTNLVEFAYRLTAQRKTIIIAGLDRSFQRKPFGSILHLIAKSESVRKFSAVCFRRIIASQDLEIVGSVEVLPSSGDRRPENCM
jgi:thymidine kinase